MKWIKTHRKAAIWIGALLAVGVVYLIRARAAATTATAGAVTPQNPNGTASQPASDYASGYDSGYTAWLGAITGGGSTGTGGGGVSSGGGGSHKPAPGPTATKGQIIAQIEKDLLKPGLSAARRAALLTRFHQLTGRTWTKAKDPYAPGHKAPKVPKAPRRPPLGGKPAPPQPRRVQRG